MQVSKNSLSAFLCCLCYSCSIIVLNTFLNRSYRGSREEKFIACMISLFRSFFAFLCGLLLKEFCMSKPKSALAIFAHPDDIEFVAAGTMLLLKEREWETHYCNLCSGNCGSATMDATTTRRTRFYESQAAAKLLGAIWHAPIADDLELIYSVENLRKVAALVRAVKPTIVLTHSPIDYMEDHMAASRLAVTAAFARGMPNFWDRVPATASADFETAVYHALPHGLCDPLAQPVTAELYVDTATVHTTKRDALAKHASQKSWLDVSQGMDSYLLTLDETSQTVGKQSGKFQHAEGWRRHFHLGFSAQAQDPLREALGEHVWKNPNYGK